jgi:hypothetical protein
MREDAKNKPFYEKLLSAKSIGHHNHHHMSRNTHFQWSEAERGKN